MAETAKTSDLEARLNALVTRIGNAAAITHASTDGDADQGHVSGTPTEFEFNANIDRDSLLKDRFNALAGKFNDLLDALAGL